MRSQFPILRRGVLSLAIPTVAVFAAMPQGCSTPQPMRSGDGVPASQGTVKATAGPNGNTNLAIRVKHLALPSKVAADTTVYVVWVQPRNGAKQSVGALVLDDNLEGSLDTVTPHRRFQLIVSPEASGQVAYPAHEAVFTADVERLE